MSALETAAFAKAAERIAAWRRPLLITHTNPDGDAIGCLVAMRSFLRALGMDAKALLFDPIPKRYAVFNRGDSIPVYGHELGRVDLDAADAIVVLDTCSYAQLDPIADWLRGSSKPKLAIDHHRTRDDLADRYLIDELAAAACLILYDWAQAVGWPIDREVAEALFVGVAMDTGWFCHSNTDQRALAAAADLVALGVDPHGLFNELYQREAPGRVRLLGAALNTLELVADGRLAVMTLTADAFSSAGATKADTEDIVNEPLRIGSVVVSALLVDHGDGLVRVSFRSKPPAAAGNPDVDVSAVAQAFGGGGHPRAAGARIPGSVAQVRIPVVDYLRAILSP